MNSSQRTAAQEWKAHWPLVVSAMLGYSFAVVPSTSLGLFMEPLQHEFGWSKSQVAAGMTVFAVVSTPLVPFAGALADRLGSRRVAVPGMALNALAFAAFGLLTASIWHWFLAWTILALTQLTSRSMVWNSAISAAFFKSRGLALAIFMSSIAMAQTVSPILTRWLIDNHGWRGAYAGLGFGWAGLGFVFVLLFFHDLRSSNRQPVEASPTAAPGTETGGLSLGQALRNPKVIRITLAIFLQSAMATAFLVHLVPLLGTFGVSRAGAANISAVIGIASLAGQLCTGWLADRVTSTILPVACFACPALGYAMIWTGHGSEALLAIGVLIAGYGTGAAVNMTTYLTSRYAGLLNFGSIFGMISSFMGLGAGLGPFAGGRIFDLTGSYSTFMMAGTVAAIISGLAVLRLGTYLEFPIPSND